MTIHSPAPSDISPSRSGATVFSSDLSAGAGEAEGLALLAELALHAGAAAPFAIGVLGGPGSGKSSFLDGLTRRIGRLAEAARTAGKGPFLSRAVHVRVDAPALAGDAAAALARRIYDALAAADPAIAGAAEEAALSLADPHAAAHEAGERYDALRRRLDSDERHLADLKAKRARIVDVLLNDSPGSRVEAYARRHRASIDAGLRRFGYGGDTLAA